MWVAINGYENIYEINELGEVRRIETGNVLKGHLSSDGYRRIGLTVSGKTKLFLVHRLVANAFIPNPNNYPCVNHKDENKSNNSINNLEWCTYRYNLNFGTRNIRANHSRKKPILQFSKNGDFIREWDSVTDLKGATGMDISHVSSCCRGKRKTANGYRWQYKNT